MRVNDVVNVLREIQNISNRMPVSATEGVELLGRVRTAAHEDLNQIPHEFLVLLAARWLQTSGHVPCGMEWFWNPRQTGGLDEPDLLGKKDGKRIVSGEATSSDKPRGAILKRMRAT